jgi:hypothetical protein
VFLRSDPIAKEIAKKRVPLNDGAGKNVAQKRPKTMQKFSNFVAIQRKAGLVRRAA